MCVFGYSCQKLSVCMRLKGHMWLLGLCCDTCKAYNKLLVTARVSHQADGGVTLFLKTWIFIEHACVFLCACGRQRVSEVKKGRQAIRHLVFLASCILLRRFQIQLVAKCMRMCVNKLNYEGYICKTYGLSCLTCTVLYLAQILWILMRAHHFALGLKEKCRKLSSIMSYRSLLGKKSFKYTSDQLSLKPQLQFS